MDGLSKNALCSGMHRNKNALHPTGENSDQSAYHWLIIWITPFCLWNKTYFCIVKVFFQKRIGKSQGPFDQNFFSQVELHQRQAIASASVRSSLGVFAKLRWQNSSKCIQKPARNCAEIMKKYCRGVSLTLGILIILSKLLWIFIFADKT